MLFSSISQSWDKYFSLFPQNKRDVYFTEAYLDINKTNGIPECIIVQANSNVWLFPYIKRQVCLDGVQYWDFESQYGYGGPVSNSNDTDFLHKAEIEFYNLLKHENFVAGLVKFHPLINNQTLLKECSTLFLNRQTIGVDLSPDLETIWLEQIHSKHRNSIRKAEKSGLEYFIDNEFLYYDEFKKLYFATMERKDADSFYLFHEDYFEKLKSEFNENSFLAHAIIDGRIISSSIFFYSQDYAHYHLSGSDPEFGSLNPNCFLIYRTIEHFKKLDKKILHLGGGTAPSTDNSLFRFKMRFSNNRYDFYIGEIVFNIPIYTKLCSDWAETNPEKVDVNKFKLLKYRL